MSKINEFYEASKGAFNGYVALSNLLVATDDLHSVMERDVEVKGVEDEDTFMVRCFDGVALAVNDKMNVVLSYPLKSELTNEQLQSCWDYRGYGGKYVYGDVTFGDVMMLLGEAIMVHHKK